MNEPRATLRPDWPAGWHVHVVDETGSTNADLLEAARAGAPDRTVLTARHQTAGRGRLDRRWEAPPGANLLVSLLFRTVPALPHELTRRVGLAAVVAAERVAGAHAGLKWPNDVMVGDAKLAGILAEADLSNREPVVVVGMGMNVGWAPEGAARLGASVDPLAVLHALLTALDELPADTEPLYRSRLATLGRTVRVELPGGETCEGRAIDVERDGRLVVLDECGISHRFDVGDVVHVR
ncbi:MAG TPA: biotin--[acetyl-CoA-carboxylase] ligase [Ilumatobacteraceae bacterium]|nr:biotin--[acetyl-CoA-carboxylase] ligase [Ilumatobacteraceae bacterium]